MGDTQNKDGIYRDGRYISRQLKKEGQALHIRSKGVEIFLRAYTLIQSIVSICVKVGTHTHEADSNYDQPQK
jgi:CTP-dependent riboflavin kinase